MATTTRALISALLKPHHNHNHSTLSPTRPSPTSLSLSRRRVAVGCTISGVGGGGGGLSETRKSEFSSEFAVIATMLKGIEPLDTSDISKGVSDTAKDSMKQTISTMLGLLPSDQFSVDVKVSRLPLHRLLVSSIITGYTLWNAEYRMSLVRNFELSLERTEKGGVVMDRECSRVKCEESECVEGEGCVICTDSSEQVSSSSLKGLSSEALSYIQRLEAELSSAKKELDSQKQDSLQIEADRGNNNNLLEYLRSLESEMVVELSQPSSVEVKEVIHELVLITIHRFFKDNATSASIGNIAIEGSDIPVGSNEGCDIFSTSRDYLAKLLFWCMLLGHHMRGLENRLHLSCVVGLL